MAAFFGKLREFANVVYVEKHGHHVPFPRTWSAYLSGILAVRLSFNALKVLGLFLPGKFVQANSSELTMDKRGAPLDYLATSCSFVEFVISANGTTLTAIVISLPSISA